MNNNNKNEDRIKSEIRAALGKHPSLRLFSNPVGTGWNGELIGRQQDLTILRNARRINYGLVTGSPDLIGWQSVTITPDMIGQRIARFVGLEIKTDRGKPSLDQTKFINVINSSGGAAGIARNIDDALDILYGAHPHDDNF